MPRDGVREQKAKPPAAELGKGCGGQEAFHRYTSCKRKTRGSVCPPLSGTRIHVTKDMEKAEVLHVFFALTSAGKDTLWDCRPLIPVGNAKAMKSQGKKCLNRCIIHSFMGCAHDW